MLQRSWLMIGFIGGAFGSQWWVSSGCRSWAATTRTCAGNGEGNFYLNFWSRCGVRRICVICDTPSARNWTSYLRRLPTHLLYFLSAYLSVQSLSLWFPTASPTPDSTNFIQNNYITRLFYISNSTWLTCTRIFMLAMEWKGEITSQPYLSGWQLFA